MATPNPTTPLSTGTLEQIGLYNLLSRIAKGHTDVDTFLLTTLHERGLIDFNTVTLTHEGELELQSLAVTLGWFYPDI